MALFIILFSVFGGGFYMYERIQRLTTHGVLIKAIVTDSPERGDGYATVLSYLLEGSH